MTAPTDPPLGGLTSAVFTSVHSLVFNTAGGYWTDAQGNHVYLIASCGGALGGFAWLLDKPANYPNNPYGPASSTLAKVVANGTRNSNGSMAYLGVNYGVELKRDGSGNNLVEAVSV